MTTLQKKQKLTTSTEKETLASSKYLRFFLDNVWLLLLPVFVGLYLFLVWLTNDVDLGWVPFLRVTQALLVFAVLYGIFFIVSKVWKDAFQKAKEDLELLYHARFLARQARSLSAWPEQKQHQIRAALLPLKQAIKSQVGLASAVTHLETLLNENNKKTGLTDYFGSLFFALFIAILLRGFLIGNFVIPSGSMIPTLQVGDHIFVNQLIYGLGIPFTKIKFGMHVREPKPGEIIVFGELHGGDRDLIKRVVAIPNDTITFCKGTDVVQINGSPLLQTSETNICMSLDKKNAETNELSDWYIEEHCRFLTEENRGTQYHIQKTQAPGTLADDEHLPTFVASHFSMESDCYSYKIPADHVFVMGDNRDNSHDSRYFGPVPYEKIKGKAMNIWWSSGVQFVKGKAQPYARLERILKTIQ